MKPNTGNQSPHNLALPIISCQQLVPSSWTYTNWNADNRIPCMCRGVRICITQEQRTVMELITRASQMALMMLFRVACESGRGAWKTSGTYIHKSKYPENTGRCCQEEVAEAMAEVVKAGDRQAQEQGLR